MTYKHNKHITYKQRRLRHKKEQPTYQGEYYAINKAKRHSDKERP